VLYVNVNTYGKLAASRRCLLHVCSLSELEIKLLWPYWLLLPTRGASTPGDHQSRLLNCRQDGKQYIVHTVFKMSPT